MENRINLSIFSTILLATILMGMIMSKYNRQRPLNQLNVLILLQAYLADTLSAINLALTLAVLIRITMGPLSRTVAELIMMLINALVCLLIILTVASSTTKLLLVANFGLVFSLDPHKLARQILGVAAILAFLPNMAFTLWVKLSQRNCCSSITTAYFTGYQDEQPGISFGTSYVLIWLLVSLILLGLVVFGIPLYLKRAHYSLAIRKKKMFNQC